METPRRTQKQRVEESARRLADAAVALIAEKGYAATTAQEIGLRAGDSRDMVRVRYGTKEALVDSVLTSLYESRLRDPDEPEMVGLDRVLAVPRLLHQFAVSDPVLLRAMLAARSAVTAGGATRTVLPVRGGRAPVVHDRAGRDDPRRRSRRCRSHQNH